MRPSIARSPIFTAPSPDTRAGIDRGRMPAVRMREGDLAEAFRRLLDNAIKFRQLASAP